MLDRGHHLVFRGTVARQLVRDHDTRGPHLPLQKLAKQTLGGPLVPPALDENVEHDPILVDRPPEPVLLAADHQAHLASRAGESHPHALPEPYVTLASYGSRCSAIPMRDGKRLCLGHRAPPAAPST